MLLRLPFIAVWRHILDRDYFTSLLHCHAQTGLDDCCGNVSFKCTRGFHGSNYGISAPPQKKTKQNNKYREFSALRRLSPEVIYRRLAQTPRYTESRKRRLQNIWLRRGSRDAEGVNVKD